MKWYAGLTLEKDPDAVKTYRWDYTAEVAAGAVLSSFQVIPDAGITVDSAALNSSNVDVTLSGGTLGVVYNVTVRITFADGSIDDRSVKFNIIEF